MTNLSGLRLLCSAKERRCLRPSGPRSPLGADSRTSGKDRQTTTRSSRAGLQRRSPACRPGPGQGSVGQAQRRAPRGGRGGTGWRHGPCPGLPKWGIRGGTASPAAGGGQAGCELPLPPLPLAYLGHFVCLRRACVPCRPSPGPVPPPTPPRPRPLGQRGCCGALPRAQGPGPAGGGGGRAGGPAGQEKVKRGPPAAPAAPGSGEMLPLGKALQGRGRAAHKSGEE